MDPAIGYSYIVPTPNPNEEVEEYYNKKKLIIKTLTDSLYQYLTIDIDHSLEQILKYSKPPVPTIDDLNHIQGHKEDLEEKLRLAMEQLNTIPDSIKDTMGPVFQVAFINPLKDQLGYYEKQISDMQRMMEKGI